MNKEDYSKIKNNPTLLYILTCAYRGHYLVGVSTNNAQILKEIYINTYPNKPKPSSNCGQCVYDFCYELGEAYFNYSEKPLMPTLDEMKAEVLMRENQPEEPEPEETADEVEEERPNEEEQPKKKGSKKKAKK